MLRLPRPWYGRVLMMLLIGALVLVVYRPLLPGAFLMDDIRVMDEDNPLVDGEFTLGNIWFQTDFVLSNIVFWLQLHLWGLHPGGFHAVNMALHALSAILLWRVLARMNIPGCGIIALIYAAHPVAVTSVARIAELKNTLSLPFFLLSFWAYLKYESGSATPAPDSADTKRQTPANSAPPIWSRWYWLALLAFFLALLSKTSTIMLPPVLLLYLWWRHGRVPRAKVFPLIPFFALSGFFGVMSAWFQKYQALAGVTLPHRSFGERLAVAGRSVWFYWGKDWLPVNQNALYPRWTIDPASPIAYLPCWLILGVLALAWQFRQTWGRHVIFAFGAFVICLFPVLGFFDGQYLTWFQVSDHLQYLPMIAPLVLGIAFLTQFLRGNVLRATVIALVLVFAALGHRRAEIFGNEETLMRDCLAKNPAAWGAQMTLGTIVAARHDLDGAVAHFEAALACAPQDPQVNLDLAHALFLQGNLTNAEPHYLIALKGRPLDAEAHRQYASLLEQAGGNTEALTQWRIAAGLNPSAIMHLGYAGILFKVGNVPAAAIQLRQAVAEKPDMPEPLNNLAWLLATCADDKVRNGPDAVRYAEKACALTSYQQPAIVGTLAAAYAEAGRFPDAMKTCQQAIDLAVKQGDTRYAAVSRQLLRMYQLRTPYHAQPATQ